MGCSRIHTTGLYRKCSEYLPGATDVILKPICTGLNYLTHNQILVNNGSDYDLVPDGTKPLPELILTLRSSASTPVQCTENVWDVLVKIIIQNQDLFFTARERCVSKLPGNPCSYRNKWWYLRVGVLCQQLWYWQLHLAATLETFIDMDQQLHHLKDDNIMTINYKQMLVYSGPHFSIKAIFSGTEIPNIKVHIRWWRNNADL